MAATVLSIVGGAATAAWLYIRNQPHKNEADRELQFWCACAGFTCLPLAVLFWILMVVS